MLVRNWQHIIVGILFVVIGFSGCALLQNSPVMELPPSRLMCGTNPKMVDGDLDTIGTFRANGTIQKLYFRENTREYNTSTKKYQIKHDGTLKTETLIKLDKPTYVSYIEIYAGSDIPKLALDFTAEGKSPKWNNSFVPVLNKRHTRVKNNQVIKFYIRQKVLYLRISADGIKDIKNQSSVDRSDSPYRYQINTPLKGAQIREVKFYERM